MSVKVEKLVLCSSMKSSGYKNVTLAVSRDAATPPVLLRSTISGPLPPDHVLLRVSHFGFSANNITYQALGSAPHFRYFDFHAAPARSETHAVVPVWGFATVVASTAPNIAPGERIFGYLAPARYLLLPVDPAATNPFHFYVPRPHLPPDRRPYNQLTRCAHDALYTARDEPLATVYRPLFWTAFWAADWLRHTTTPAYAAARTILLSSASARTAFCLAFCLGLHNRTAPRIRIVGLTSARNRAFVERLALYDSVHVYDALEDALTADADQDGSVLYVDVAGSAVLNRRVWTALGPRAVRSVSLGMTTIIPTTGPTYIPPPSGVTQQQSTATHTLSFFFMPEQLAQRRAELGATGIAAMQRDAWAELVRVCRAWGEPERVWGAERVRDAWARAVEGESGGGGGGGVWSMWEEEEELVSEEVEKARL